MLIYVDDILVICSNGNKLEWFLCKLKGAFPNCDLEPLKYFLGIEAKQLPSELLLSQHKYITDLLEHTQMASCKSCLTPTATAPSLTKIGSKPFENGELYRQMVGAL